MDPMLPERVCIGCAKLEETLDEKGRHYACAELTGISTYVAKFKKNPAEPSMPLSFPMPYTPRICQYWC
jgi:hypothetical protein